MDCASRQKLAVMALVTLGLTGVGVGLARRNELPRTAGSKVEIISPRANSNSASDPLPVLDMNVTADEMPSAAPVASVSEVVVHVCGQVKKPGVYHLPVGSRVMDAVDAAGGARDGADLESVNLAAKAQDGEQIYLARAGEATPRAVSEARLSGGTAPPVSSAVTSRNPVRSTPPALSSKVNINTASAQQLDRLPGVGPATAAKIIQYRKAVGGFVRPEDLMNVPGIGEKKFAEMRSMVVVH